MCEEIELRRYDDTPWGFRLTGGHDFGIPLTVVRVTGGSLAEEAGMCVGDMIIEINGDNTAQITHSEAQQCILEAGNYINLSILRGSPVPAVTPTRGLYTPAVTDRAASSVESLTEYESIHSDIYREHAVSTVSEPYESGHEMTEEEIAEKLLENAEVIENNGKNVIGVNFKRFVPKCDFIKNSLVFQTLQEEQIFDQKSEQEQLKKYPTKRFSTFLTTPNRPKIKPPEKKKIEESKMIEENESEVQQVVEKCMKPDSCEQECTNGKCELKDIEDFVVPVDTITIENNDMHAEEHNDNSEIQSKIIETEVEEPKNNQEISEDILTDKELNDISQELKTVDVKKEPTNDFERSLLDIQNQLSAIRQLPLQIQNHISLLEKQLSDLLLHKIKSTETSEGVANENEQIENIIKQEHDENEQQEKFDDDDDVFETDIDDTFENLQEMEPNEKSEETSDEESNGKEDKEISEDEFNGGEYKEPSGRPMYPLTPLPRPIVLPGGRKWRGPKDAYNEKFIAETLISQAEVLVGSTLGVNFRKYEPPKFDLSNSAVYKLVHNIETKNIGGIANRPETVAAKEDFYYHKPIDARQFYLATLPQPTIIPDYERDNQYGH
ncbi:PDZ domain [Cinara cedri]|uniref:PDZ domain n=1 Tax=Cinara cedri TaxID=506608 RepID=A0A5E4NC66_9HEMI|nr:PDZ domain [Cinara cedri]